MVDVNRHKKDGKEEFLAESESKSPYLASFLLKLLFFDSVPQDAHNEFQQPSQCMEHEAQ